MDNDEYIIDISSGNIITTNTIDLGSNTFTWSTDISGYTADTIDLDNITITLNDPVEFEDHMPSVAKVEDMCREYPTLEKAYENFKTIYKMVHQDWVGRQREKNKPPF